MWLENQASKDRLEGSGCGRGEVRIECPRASAVVGTAGTLSLGAASNGKSVAWGSIVDGTILTGRRCQQRRNHLRNTKSSHLPNQASCTCILSVSVDEICMYNLLIALAGLVCGGKVGLIVSVG